MISQLGDKLYLTIINFWSWWWEVDNQQDELACITLTISVPLLLLLWWWCTRTSAWSRIRGTPPLPPGPYGLPLVGYLPFLTSNLHETFTQMAHDYGPIFSLWLGTKLHVVVNSTDLVKVVSRDQDHTFSYRSPSQSAKILSYGGIDIAWSNGTLWRNLRKILVSQLLSNANLDASKSLRTDGVRNTVKDVYEKIGKKIDINEVAFHTELDVVTNMLWGCSKGNNDHDSGSIIGDGFREVEFKIIELLGAPNISDFIPMLSWFDLQGRQREMQKQKEHLDMILDDIIERRMNENSRKMEGEVKEEDERKDFLQILLELKEGKDGSISFDFNQIKALLMDVVTAATDTTSTMAEWVMAEILQNPRVKTKIQEELTNVIGMNNIVEESHLSKLIYLDVVIKETFRLHPPLPLLIQRCPNESCTVGGYTIPKGTLVLMNIWVIQRDPQNWTDPLEFIPERFLKGKWDYYGNNLMFLPFGSGRRICPGISLGEKMLMYILASLLHSFEWSLPKDEDFELKEEFGFVMKKRKPLTAIPSQRLQDASLYV